MGLKLFSLLNQDVKLKHGAAQVYIIQHTKEKAARMIGIELTATANSGIGSGNLYSAALQMCLLGCVCALLMIEEEGCRSEEYLRLISFNWPNAKKVVEEKEEEKLGRSERGGREEKGEHISNFEEKRALLQEAIARLPYLLLSHSLSRGGFAMVSLVMFFLFFSSLERLFSF